jgi:hypothetical protein
VLHCVMSPLGRQVSDPQAIPLPAASGDMADIDGAELSTASQSQLVRNCHMISVAYAKRSDSRAFAATSL